MLANMISRSRHVHVMVALLLVTAPVAAGERGTPEEAQALVARAVALYDEVGSEAAFAAFEDPDGDFVDRDLYVFVYGPDRTIAAHGADRSLVGAAADSFRDLDGVAFGSRFMDESTEEGGWIDYKWRDPISGEVQPKSSWVVKHEGYIFGAGVYKP